MNTEELLAQAKKLIAKGDLSAAKKFVEDNKDNLGEHFDKAKKLLEATDLGGLAAKVKDIFGK